MKSWQEKMREKEQELRTFISVVESQRDEALNALRDLAAGLATSGHPASWSHEVKMRVDAGNALKSIAQRISRYRP